MHRLFTFFALFSVFSNFAFVAFTTTFLRPTPTITACNHPDWAPGHWYNTGDIVRYNGSYYIAEHDNPGYDPTVSTWFWDPYTCTGTPTLPPLPPNPGTSCNYPDWVAGQQYYTGNIVRYNGSYYIAKRDNPGYDPTVSTWFWDPYTCRHTDAPAGTRHRL